MHTRIANSPNPKHLFPTFPSDFKDVILSYTTFSCIRAFVLEPVFSYVSLFVSHYLIVLIPMAL